MHKAKTMQVVHAHKQPEYMLRHLFLPRELANHVLQADVSFSTQVPHLLRQAGRALPAVQVGALPVSAYVIDQVLVEESRGSVLVIGHLVKVHGHDMVLLAAVPVDNVDVVRVVDP